MRPWQWATPKAAPRPARKLNELSIDAITSWADRSKDISAAREFIASRLDAALAAIDESDDLSADRKEKRRAELLQSAEFLLMTLDGRETRRFGRPA